MTEWRRNESISVPICESPTRQTRHQPSGHPTALLSVQTSRRSGPRKTPQAASAEPEAETGVEYETDEEAATTVSAGAWFHPERCCGTGP